MYEDGSWIVGDVVWPRASQIVHLNLTMVPFDDEQARAGRCRPEPGTFPLHRLSGLRLPVLREVSTRRKRYKNEGDLSYGS